jgi:uncharacterized membrane protein YdbT with pleckstrin-like domain
VVLCTIHRFEKKEGGVMQTPNYSQLSNKQDKEPSQQQQRPAEEFTWSSTRVIEQVIINVTSAVIIGVIAVPIAVVSSFFLWLFHVIPANWLLAAIAILVGMVLTFLVLAFLLWLLSRKYPGVILGLIFGLALGSRLNSILDTAARTSEKRKAKSSAQ